MRLTFLRFKKAFPWVLTIKIVLVLFPVAVLVSLINHNLFITNLLRYSYQPGHIGRAVGPVTPAQLLKTGDPHLRWRVAADSFMFNVNIPRLIEKIRVRVRLNPGTQPYVALTAFGPKGADRSTIISATGLDTLDWKHVSDGNLTLWMRDKHISQEKVVSGTGKNTTEKTVTIERPVIQYSSIESFRSNLPDINLVGLVGIERMAFAKVENYIPSATPIKLGHTLRGSHQLYVYAADENLKLTFDKVDLNRSAGPDGITIRVARVGDLRSTERTWIKTVKVGDDGISGKDGRRGKVQPVVVEISDVEPGVYFIDIGTSADVLLTNIISSQGNVSFSGNIFIAEGPAYAEPKFTPVIMQTNGTIITFAANHEQGQQDVTVGGKRVSVQDVKVNHVYSSLSGLTTIEIPKGDIIISSDDLLTFNGFELLPNGGRNIDLTTGLPELNGIDYVIADYVPRSGETLEFDQTYLLSDLDLKVKTVGFSIYSPGLETNGATLGLKDIRVTLERGPFPWDKVWQKFGLKKK